MLWFFGCEASGILVPWPGTELTCPASAGEVLTFELPGKSPNPYFCSLSLLNFYDLINKKCSLSMENESTKKIFWKSLIFKTTVECNLDIKM